MNERKVKGNMKKLTANKAIKLAVEQRLKLDMGQERGCILELGGLVNAGAGNLL